MPLAGSSSFRRCLSTRIDAIKMGVVIALSEGAISKEDTLVCLSGLSDNGEIDTLITFRPDREKEILLTPEIAERIERDRPQSVRNGPLPGAGASLRGPGGETPGGSSRAGRS